MGVQVRSPRRLLPVTPTRILDTVRFTLLTLCVPLAVAGCSAPLDGTEALAADEGFLGLMWVEQQEGDGLLGPDGVADPGEAEIGAAFASYRGLDGTSAFRLLGREPGLFPCQEHRSAMDGVGPHAAVELHDVGEVSVAVHDDRVGLHPRTFPDVAGIMSGAFYAEDTPLSRPTPGLDSYAMDMGYASAAVLAPAGFGTVLVSDAEGGEAVRQRAQAGSAPLQLQPGRDAVVRWRGGDPSDRVELVLSTRERQIRCVVVDQGYAHIPGVVSGQLAGASEAQLVMRRVRQHAAVPASMPWRDGTEEPGLVWFAAVIRRSVSVSLAQF